MYCTQCGYKNTESGKFCIECGAHLKREVPSKKNGKVNGTRSTLPIIGGNYQLLVVTVVFLLVLAIILMNVFSTDQVIERKYVGTWISETEHIIKKLELNRDGIFKVEYIHPRMPGLDRSSSGEWYVVKEGDRETIYSTPIGFHPVRKTREGHLICTVTDGIYIKQ